MESGNHWFVSLWWKANDVSHCRLLSSDEVKWRLVSTTLCWRWSCCLIDSLWHMQRRRCQILTDLGSVNELPSHLSLWCVSLRNEVKSTSAHTWNSLTEPKSESRWYANSTFTLSAMIVPQGSQTRVDKLQAWITVHCPSLDVPNAHIALFVPVWQSVSCWNLNA